MALENLPADLFIAFHSPTEMLFSLQGIHAFFLDSAPIRNVAGKNRLLWFIREKQSVFGFVLSHYPVEEELGRVESQDRPEIIRYISFAPFLAVHTQCRMLLSESYEAAEEKQWHTLKVAEMVAGELWPEEGLQFFITIVSFRGTDS